MRIFKDSALVGMYVPTLRGEPRGQLMWKMRHGLQIDMLDVLVK